MRALARSSLALGLCALAAACDPVFISGVALTPRPAASADSVRYHAFALAARVAARHGLRPTDRRRQDVHEQGSSECFERDHGRVSLCGTAREGQVQFWLFELNPRTRLGFKKFGGSSDEVSRLRRELLDSLRAQFGAQRVHECDRQGDSEGLRSGCAPLTPADSA